MTVPLLQIGPNGDDPEAGAAPDLLHGYPHRHAGLTPPGRAPGGVARVNAGECYGAPMSESMSIRELIERLEALDAARGVERIRLAAELDAAAHETLLAEGDRGAWEATRPGVGTRRAVAERFGWSVPYIQKRASRHAGRRAAAVDRKADRKSGM